MRRMPEGCQDVLPNGHRDRAGPEDVRATRRRLRHRAARAAPLALTQPNRGRDAVVDEAPENLLPLIRPGETPYPFEDAPDRFQLRLQRADLFGRRVGRHKVDVASGLAVAVKAGGHLAKLSQLLLSPRVTVARDLHLRAATNREG